jgi:hypothetical protein
MMVNARPFRRELVESVFSKYIGEVMKIFGNEFFK